MGRKIKVGEELTPFVRATGLANWNRYAAVNNEFVPIHMDDEAGRKAGYPSAFGMGNLQWAYLHNALRDWLGEEGEILELSCQYRSANVKNQTLTVRGVVRDVSEDDFMQIIDLELWVEDQNGVKLAPGSAKVALPR